MDTNVKAISLNEGQAEAVRGILDWLNDPAAPRMGLLSGEAGTGKTFCLQVVCKEFKGRIAFTAPTNKATKVLRTTLREAGITPVAKTIYSLLGLRLMPNGEIKELQAADDDAVDLSKFAAVCIDEGSMVNELLMEHIQQAADDFPNIKFLFIGDEAQLPPVGEARSSIWGIEPHWHLTEQMRNAGPILRLARTLREQQSLMAPRFAPVNEATDRGAVAVLHADAFEAGIRDAARAGEFGKANTTKIVCWRNATVDYYNRMVRQVLFDDPSVPWHISDRIILTEPARDFIENRPIASTDDEGLVEAVSEVMHPVYNMMCWRVTATLDDNRIATLWVLHPSSEREHKMKETDLATRAKANGRLWREFWDFKDSFHKIRHAYAITAHRAQGSTYQKVFVNYRDILANRDRREAYKCLYVACTRSKVLLNLG